MPSFLLPPHQLQKFQGLFVVGQLRLPKVGECWLHENELFTVLANLLSTATSPSDSIAEGEGYWRRDLIGMAPVATIRGYLSTSGGFLTYNGTTGDFSTSYTPANKAGETFTGDVLLAGPGAGGANATNASRAIGYGEFINAIDGLAWKNKVRLATTGNEVLSGVARNIDGVLLAANDRVLVRAQTNTADNGIYVAKSGAWTRALDADSWPELVSATVRVAQGTTSADKAYTCTADDGGAIGSTPLLWVETSAGSSYLAGTGLQLSGNTFSLDVTGAKAALGIDGKVNIDPGAPLATTVLTFTKDAFYTDLTGVNPTVTMDFTGAVRGVTAQFLIASTATGTFTYPASCKVWGGTTFVAGLEHLVTIQYISNSRQNLFITR
jgi:hypothetical protein